jgi:protein gp37
MATKIQWTDVTDNIMVVKGGGHWCRKFNALCANCYAEAINQNPFFGGNKLKYSGQPPEMELRREMIAAWARQRKPKKHFVASMTDVFGEWVARSWQFEMLDGMLAAPLQIFQVLTKRTGVCLTSVKFWMAARGIERPPANVWLGFSAGNQETFDEAWADMKQLAALGFTVFASLEPMLGHITLPDDFLAYGSRVQVITGGESGKKARPAHPRWFRSLYDQCEKAGVAYFFKQFGEWVSFDHPAMKTEPILPLMDKEKHGVFDERETFRLGEGTFSRYENLTGLMMYRVGKKKSGRLLDGREHNAMPTDVRAKSPACRMWEAGEATKIAGVK